MEYDYPDINVSTRHDHGELLSRADFQGLVAAQIELYPHIYFSDCPTIDNKLDEVIGLLEEELAK